MQVKAGSIFDNFLVTDDAEYAKKFAEETWGAMKDVSESCCSGLSLNVDGFEE